MTNLDAAFDAAVLKVKTPIRKAILNALSERDEAADICRDADGKSESDPELRDTENVPLPPGIKLPIRDDDLPKLKKLCEEYLAREVLPHVPDAWVDHSKTKIGYEIPLTRHFYKYVPPRPLAEIDAEIKTLEGEIQDLLSQVTK